MPLAQAVECTLEVARVLDELGVPYLVGGSLASSLHGIPRSTQDADLVAELELSHVSRLVERLGSDFYLDADAIREAIRGKRCFNLIHLATMFKVDVFIPGDDTAQREEMRRRQTYVVDPDSGRTLSVASAEDIILQKLDWYRQAEGLSERQWDDVIGVIQVRGPELDLCYLRQSAARMGIADLLERALSAATSS
ncbi:MAG: hypothetical protein JXR96_02430 [Deltaproteobacteria bacterium]|nr:hypothetical protein [Deltaproteobacteria bacterium]